MDPITFSHRRSSGLTENFTVLTYTSASLGSLFTTTPSMYAGFNVNNFKIDSSTGQFLGLLSSNSASGVTKDFLEYDSPAPGFPVAWDPSDQSQVSGYGYSKVNNAASGSAALSSDTVYNLSKFIHDPFEYVDIHSGNVPYSKQNTTGRIYVAKSDDGQQLIATGYQHSDDYPTIHIQVSSDSGISWKLVDTGIAITTDTTPFISYSNNQFVMVLSSDRTASYRSSDGGLTWDAKNTNGRFAQPIFESGQNNVYISTPNFIYFLESDNTNFCGYTTDNFLSTPTLRPNGVVSPTNYIRGNVQAVKTVNGVPQSDAVFHAGDGFWRVYWNGTSVVEEVRTHTNLCDGIDKVPFAMFYREADSSYYVMIRDTSLALSAGFGAMVAYKSSDDGATWTQVGTQSYDVASWETYQSMLNGVVYGDSLIATAGGNVIPSSNYSTNAHHVRYNIATDTWDNAIYADERTLHAFLYITQMSQTSGECVVVGSSNTNDTSVFTAFTAKVKLSDVPVGYKIPKYIQGDLSSNSVSEDMIFSFYHSQNGSNWSSLDTQTLDKIPYVETSSLSSLDRAVANDGENLLLAINAENNSYRTDTKQSYGSTVLWKSSINQTGTVNNWQNIIGVSENQIESLTDFDLSSSSLNEMLPLSAPDPTDLSYTLTEFSLPSSSASKYLNETDNHPFRITSIKVVDNNTWYVGCSKQKLYKTTDGGSTWTDLSDGSLQSLISATATSRNVIDEVAANISIVGVESNVDGSTVFISTTFGFYYVSTDGGSTWTDVTTHVRTISGTDSFTYSRSKNYSKLKFVNGYFFHFGAAVNYTEFLYSQDGITWTKKTINSNSQAGFWSDISYNTTDGIWALVSNGSRGYVAYGSDINGTLSVKQFTGTLSWAGSATSNFLTMPNGTNMSIEWNDTDQRWELLSPTRYSIYVYGSDFSSLSVNGNVFWQYYPSVTSINPTYMFSTGSSRFSINTISRTVLLVDAVDETNSGTYQYSNQYDRVSLDSSVWNHYNSIFSYDYKGDTLVVGGDWGELAVTTDGGSTWNSITTLKPLTEQVSKKPEFNLTWAPSASDPSKKYLQNVDVTYSGNNVHIDSPFSLQNAYITGSKSDSSQVGVFLYKTSSFASGSVSLSTASTSYVFMNDDINAFFVNYYKDVNLRIFTNVTNSSNFIPKFYFTLDGGLTFKTDNMIRGNIGTVTQYSVMNQTDPVVIYTRSYWMNLDGTPSIYLLGVSGTGDGTTATFENILHKASINSTNDGLDIDTTTNLISGMIDTVTATSAELFSKTMPDINIYGNTNSRRPSRHTIIQTSQRNQFNPSQNTILQTKVIDGNFDSVYDWTVPSLTYNSTDISSKFAASVPIYSDGIGKWYMISQNDLYIASSHDFVNWDVVYDPFGVL